MRLEPLSQKLDSLERAVRENPTVDLQRLYQQISALEQRMARIPEDTNRPAVDLSPVLSRLSAIEKRVSATARHEPLDLQADDAKPPTIEAEPRRPGGRLKRRSDPSASAGRDLPASIAKGGGPQLFSGPCHGTKDDLKRISGIGPKLERLLNRNGVYYFWQIASWSRADVEFMDVRLDAFRGRITRDAWVSQAQTLRQQPTAAKRPSD